MRLVANIAALHGAYWSFDRWYRMWWHVWPTSLALLICGWIYIDKPGTGAASPQRVSSLRFSWGKPVATVTTVPVPNSPVLANWPDKLHSDVITCFSYAKDPNPLIEACTRLIGSGAVANPQLVTAYGQRGYLQRLKQPDRALEDFDAALKIQPNTPFALTNRAFIYTRQSRFDDALNDLNKAIELLPPGSAWWARYLRGFSHARLKDYGKAMDDLNESLRLEPNNPYSYLARAEVEQAQQLNDAALRDFDEFNKRAWRDPSGLIGRAAVLESIGRVPEALAALDRARPPPCATECREQSLSRRRPASTVICPSCQRSMVAPW